MNPKEICKGPTCSNHSSWSSIPGLFGPSSAIIALPSSSQKGSCQPSPTSVCLRLVCVGWELFPMYTATPHTLDMCGSDDRPVFSFQSMIFQYFSYLFHHALHFVTGGTLSKSFAKNIGTIFRGQTLYYMNRQKCDLQAA